jgi:hypothetical protein
MFKRYFEKRRANAIKKKQGKYATLPTVPSAVKQSASSVSTQQPKPLPPSLREENMYKNPFVEGEQMPCCDRKYCFSYHAAKYLPRTNRKLKWRDENTIDYDPASRNPKFCDYNETREAIRQAKAAGYDHVHWRMSVAVAEEIVKDGYRDHNDKFDTISW